ncbi:class E sortase [Spirillospora sp. NPDC049652]
MQLRQLLAGATAGLTGWAGLAGPVHAAQIPDRPGPAARHGARPYPRGGGPSRHIGRAFRKGRVQEPVRLIVPKLGIDGRVREGVSDQVLHQGIGHYPGTAAPGRIGNAVYLGHRTTGAKPFAELERMAEGDAVVLVAGRRHYTYRVTGTKIILPSETKVVAPVPMHPGRRPTERWATLITCYPRWSDSHRFVVFARLAR